MAKIDFFSKSVWPHLATLRQIQKDFSPCPKICIKMIVLNFIKAREQQGRFFYIDSPFKTSTNLIMNLKLLGVRFTELTWQSCHAPSHAAQKQLGLAGRGRRKREERKRKSITKIEGWQQRERPAKDKKKPFPAFLLHPRRRFLLYQ